MAESPRPDVPNGVYTGNESLLQTGHEEAIRLGAVTITIPVFNAMPYLPEAVFSVLQQTCESFKILVINDGSTDGSAEFLDSIRDPRVTIIHQPNSGLGTTLNRLVHLCDTKYFARMDADDLCDPRRLEFQLEYLEAHPEVVMLGTQISFTASGKTVQAGPAPLDHDGIRRRLLDGKAGVCHPTIVFRTAIARAIGGYRISGAGEDIDFCLRMCEQGRVANLPQVLYSYRITRSSLGISQRPVLERGYKFAIRCAMLRSQSLPEPTFEDFARQWEQRSRYRRFFERVDALAESHYRRGILSSAEGRYSARAVHFALAALLRPKAVVNRVRRILHHEGGIQ